MGDYLFISEGSRDEAKLLNSLFHEMKRDDRQHCYYYSCNLHALANLLLPTDGDDLEGIDLLMTLRGSCRSQQDYELLSHRYTDVILIFDFEPQENAPAFEKIRKMAAYFNDSTDNGKLYINYPMMQSYRHLIAPLPDQGFEFRTAKRYIPGGYKQLVEQEARAIPSGTQTFDHFQLYTMAVHHLKKREKVLGRPYGIPEDYDEAEDERLFDIQTQKLFTEECCYVLNTSILLLVAYQPTKFLREVTAHPDRYAI